MLDSFRRGQRWLTGIFIAVIGGVFVFFLGLGGPLQTTGPSGQFVVQLDDTTVDPIDFDRVRQGQEERMRQALGDSYDPKAAGPFVDQQALRAVVEQVVLSHSAREMGLHVTKQEVQRYLRESPNFRDPNGRFDQELVVKYIERTYGSQRAFLDTVEREFLVQKIVGLLYDQISVSDAELRDSIRSRLEEVSIAFVALDPEALPAGEELAEEDIEAFRAANEDTLRAEYDARKSEFTEVERAHVRHLLIRTEPSDDEATLQAARERAEAARERIAAGGAFADIAQEVSEDDGTRELGGDLGLVSRSEISAGLSETAFGLEVGALSEVVKTERGFHVVTIDERRPAGERAFEDVAAELAREGATMQAARTRAQDLSTALSQAVRDGASLEDAARAEQLTLVRTAPLRRRTDGYIPDLGAAPEVMSTAFALEPGTSSPRIFEVGERLVLISLTSRKAPSDADVEAQLENGRRQLIDTKRQEAVRGWIDAEQNRFDKAGRLRVNASLVIGS